MTEDSQIKLQELQNKLSELQNKAHLGDTSEEMNRITTSLGDIAKELDDLQREGYAFTAPLRARLQALQTQWNTIRANLDVQYEHHQHVLTHESKQASRFVDGSQKSGSGDDPLTAAEEAMDALSQRLEDISGQFDDWMQPFSRALYTIENQIRRIKWSQEHWSETVADVANDNLHLAADAEWVVSGRDKDDPDGILFLTDQHVIFEQKEKKGGILGMGSKKVHELEWVAPLSSLSGARAEDKGMFGGKDMLHLTFSGDAPHAEVTLEIKGGIDSKVWQAYIEKVQSSGTVFSDALDTELPTVPGISAEQIAALENIEKATEKASNQIADHAISIGKNSPKKDLSASDIFGNKAKDSKKDVKQSPKADVLKQFRAKSADDDADKPQANTEHNPFANRKPPQK